MAGPGLLAGPRGPISTLWVCLSIRYQTPSCLATNNISCLGLLDPGMLNGPCVQKGPIMQYFLSGDENLDQADDKAFHMPVLWVWQ